MVAALDDTTLFQDHDAVTVFDSGQSVGDDKGGSALHQFIHAVLYDFLSTGINGAGSLIQDPLLRLWRWTEAVSVPGLSSHRHR